MGQNPEETKGEPTPPSTPQAEPYREYLKAVKAWWQNLDVEGVELPSTPGAAAPPQASPQKPPAAADFTWAAPASALLHVPGFTWAQATTQAAPFTWACPPASGFTWAAPPTHAGFTWASAPAPTGFTWAVPPPPSGFTWAAPPTHAGFTWASAPAPSGFTWAVPPPPPGFTWAAAHGTTGVALATPPPPTHGPLGAAPQSRAMPFTW